MPKLPDFVTFINLPKEYTITNRSDGYTLEENPKLLFKTVKEAYYHVKDKLNGNPLFSKDIQLEEGDELDGGFLFLGSENSKDASVQVLLALSNKERTDFLKYSYKEFLKIAKKFKKNSNDFYTAYMFLESHPIFWHRSLENPNSWRTNEGLNALWTTVVAHKNKKGIRKVVFLMEHGEYLSQTHEGIDYTHVVSSHDTRLDVVAKTYEKAIIKLAKNVYKHYNNDGSEKQSDN